VSGTDFGDQMGARQKSLTLAETVADDSSLIGQVRPSWDMCRGIRPGVLGKMISADSEQPGTKGR
jgi:hypothetical protein